MTMDRFRFQRECVFKTTGIVLNVGANEDPGNLKSIDTQRVINCDIEEVDSYLNRPNKVDVLFDCTKPWPMPDDFAELVVFGDILEHLYPSEAIDALTEAHRVAQKLCITVPRDNRFQYNNDVEKRNGYRTHCYEWHRPAVEWLLDKTGWSPVEWQTVDYYFVPEGYFILSERKDADEEIYFGVDFGTDDPTIVPVRRPGPFSDETER